MSLYGILNYIMLRIFMFAAQILRTLRLVKMTIELCLFGSYLYYYCLQYRPRRVRKCHKCLSR